MQIRNILCVAILSTMLVSCGTDFKKTKGGLPYKLFSKGGQKVEKGDFIKYEQVVRVQWQDSATNKQKDSLLFSTYAMEQPQYARYTDRSEPYDLSEIIPLLHKGDSVYAVQSIDTFIKRNAASVPPIFKKGSKMFVTLRVTDIFKSQKDFGDDYAKQKERVQKKQTEARENAFKNDPAIKAQLQKDVQAITDYLSQNKIQAQKTPTGAFVQLVSSGSGTPIKAGNFVSVKYKGQTFAGKVFDTNMDNTFKHTQPLDFTVGVGQMLKGFDEGLLTLKKGDKARIYIPSSLAYGPNPPSPLIGANENLIFDIEVLNVLDKAPEPQNAPPAPHE